MRPAQPEGRAACSACTVNRRGSRARRCSEHGPLPSAPSPPSRAAQHLLHGRHHLAQGVDHAVLDGVCMRGGRQAEGGAGVDVAQAWRRRPAAATPIHQPSSATVHLCKRPPRCKLTGDDLANELCVTELVRQLLRLGGARGKRAHALLRLRLRREGGGRRSRGRHGCRRDQPTSSRRLAAQRCTRRRTLSRPLPCPAAAQHCWQQPSVPL